MDPFTLFSGLVNQYKAPENGLVQLFSFSNLNIFGGSQVEFDVVCPNRTLPEAKRRGGGYNYNENDQFKNRKFEPPVYKEATIYEIASVRNRQAGTTKYDDIDYTMLLAEKTARDVAYLLDKIELGKILQAAQIFQLGKIPFNSVFGYTTDDIDFNCPSAHFATVGTLWNAGAGNPLHDLSAHASLITKNGRRPIDNYAFGKNALVGFLANADVRAELDNRRIDRGNLSFENVQMNGLQRIGIYNINGRVSTLWTYDEFYETKNASDAVNATIDFLDTNKVIMWASTGDYQQYYAGIDTIKDIPQGMGGFLDSPAINIVGDRVKTQVWLSTDVVKNGANSGVFLHADSAPLLVPRTNNTFGCLTVTS